MIIMYDIFYKDEEDNFKKTHFHSRVLYKESAITVCEILEAIGKKPWFHYVKVES